MPTQLSLLGEERKATATRVTAESKSRACNIKDVTRNRHRGNAESEAAYESVKHRMSADRHTILTYMRFSGPQTSKELSLNLQINYTTMSARLSELKAMGLIEKTGERREGCAVVRVK